MTKHRKKNVEILIVVVVAICAVQFIGRPVTCAQDKELKPYTVENCRDMRFGEIVVIGEKVSAIYNTTGLNDCPAKLWDAMDIEALKKHLTPLRFRRTDRISG